MKISTLIISAGLALSQPLYADYDRFCAVEIHSGPVFSSDTITNVDIDEGFSFGATVSYYFLNKQLGVYSGFDVDVFDADSLSNSDVDAAVLFGYSAGMEYRGTIPNTRLGYFGRGGFHISKLQLLDDDDDDVSETKYDTGFETSAGLTYDLGSNWALRGGLRYKTFSRRFKTSVDGRDAELDSTTVIIGARYNF